MIITTPMAQPSPATRPLVEQGLGAEDRERIRQAFLQLEDWVGTAKSRGLSPASLIATVESALDLAEAMGYAPKPRA